MNYKFYLLPQHVMNPSRQIELGIRQLRLVDMGF